MTTPPNLPPISKPWPSAEYKYFLYDPERGGLTYYRSVEDRDAAAHDAIQSYLDDVWSEEVENVVAGEITHHAVARNVERQPERQDCDSDEDYEIAIDEWGDADCTYKCRYELAPISDPGEETP